MKSQGEYDRIGSEAQRTGNQAPTGNQSEDADVHRVAHESVKAHDHQFLGGIPRRQRALAGNIKVADAPEQDADAKEQYRPTKPSSSHPLLVAFHQQPWKQYAESARKDQESK